MDHEADVEQAAPEAAGHVEEKNTPLVEAGRHAGWSLAAMFAPPAPPSGPMSLATAGPMPALAAPTLRNVQRLAGNGAAVAVIDRLRDRFGVQRDPLDDEEEAAPVADVSVTGLTLSADTVTLPLAGDLRATATPETATGVSYSVAAGTADPSNVAIDASTGVITISEGQQGGTVAVSADGSDGSGASVDLIMIERPSAITATATSGTQDYGGQFTHTFSAPSGQPSGLEGANINEEFSSLTATPPWGGTFTLTANAAGSPGWDLDSSGTMAGPDNVTIGSAGVNIGRLLNSTSNPNPTATLPQGFTMTQSLYATVLPGGSREGTPFQTVSHTRRLIDGPQFEVSAGMGTITEDYSGPAAVTNAAASSSTVMASPPRPESGTWSQRKVTVTADAIPDTASLSYSIRGNRLGCSVDSDGEVSIGERAGTLTVRATASRSNFDEVAITITRYVAPEGSESEPESTPESTGPAAEPFTPETAPPIDGAPVDETAT